MALECRGPNYRGALRLVAHRPQIACETITNLRVTDRAIEETILLDFNIQNAGIREVSFLLPEWMRDSRIQVPLLRQKIVQPAGKAPGSPILVRLELQDEVMNDLRVLVENDRQLASQFEAPIPRLDSSVAPVQFVTLQSSGRDEVALQQASGAEPIGRQSETWRRLQTKLRGGMTQAFQLSAAAPQTQIRFEARARSALQVAGARIGLAETQLVLDSSGAYRATQTYRLHNATEPYLEVELPEGASLWTAWVAGDPVRPVRPTDVPSSSRVRIPLVKTAAGDLDYPVVLKYGGRIDAPSLWSQVRFPLPRTMNIDVELSHVRLHLPETRHWMNFDGTMRYALDENDLAAGRLSYQTKSVERLVDVLRNADPFAKVRAAANLKKQLSIIEDQKKSDRGDHQDVQVQQELVQNSAVVREAEGNLDASRSCRRRTEQSTIVHCSMTSLPASRTSARNVVGKLGGNWDAEKEAKPSPPGATGAEFNERWLRSNRLDSAARQTTRQNSRCPVVRSEERPRLGYNKPNPHWGSGRRAG